MKNYLTLIICMLGLSSAVVSQAPQKLSYQAIVRNAAGQPVASNTPVLVRFTIHDSLPGGTIVYTEIQSTLANAFGLVNLMIGTNVSLATINWASGAKYLQVEANVNNAGFYTDMGTTQLMSVPYALFAANSANGPPGATGPTGATGIAGPTGATGATSIAGQQVHKRYDAAGFIADCEVQSCSEYFTPDTSWAIPDTGNFYVSLSPGTWAVLNGALGM